MTKVEYYKTLIISLFKENNYRAISKSELTKTVKTWSYINGMEVQDNSFNDDDYLDALLTVCERDKNTKMLFLKSEYRTMNRNALYTYIAENYILPPQTLDVIDGILSFVDKNYLTYDAQLKALFEMLFDGIGLTEAEIKEHAFGQNA